MLVTPHLHVVLAGKDFNRSLRLRENWKSRVYFYGRSGDEFNSGVVRKCLLLTFIGP